MVLPRGGVCWLIRFAPLSAPSSARHAGVLAPHHGGPRLTRIARSCTSYTTLRACCGLRRRPPLAQRSALGGFVSGRCVRRPFHQSGPLPVPGCSRRYGPGTKRRCVLGERGVKTFIYSGVVVFRYTCRKHTLRWHNLGRAQATAAHMPNTSPAHHCHRHVLPPPPPSSAACNRRTHRWR